MKKINWTPEIRKALLNIADLENSRIDQSMGSWVQDVPCCFGAHLAKEFDVQNHYGVYFYTNGRNELSKRLGLTVAELGACLRSCGAHHTTPFGGKEWPRHHRAVIRDFLRMNRIPKEW